MWPGPYGEWGSRKYLLASLDQSLKRMGLDYVDIFYSHRFDPETPLEETMGALDAAVRQGKALYVGISSYNSRRTKEAAAILKRLGTPCLIHQPSYSMLNRWIENDGLLDTLEAEGHRLHRLLAAGAGHADRQISRAAFRPTAARRRRSSFDPKFLTPETIGRVRALNEIARRRGQTLAQMALAWVLRDPRVTSALIGASRPEQVDRRRRGARQARLLGRRVEGDRPPRGRRRDQPLGAVGGARRVKPLSHRERGRGEGVRSV